jgi:uncharacterized membrane protein SpoIIM required for sporulation
MMEWIKGHEMFILFMTGVSIVTFIATLIAVPWLVVRIPSNYFSKKRRVTKLWADQHPVVRVVLLTVKNLAGYFLIAAGIVMLFIPGQGLLTILIGIIFLDLPGKYRFERWIITRPAVLRSVNWLRRRARKAPLELR